MPGLAKPVAAVSGRRGEPAALQEQLCSAAPGLLSLPHLTRKPIHLPLPVLKGLLLTMLQSILSFPLNKTLSGYSSPSYFLRVYGVPGTILVLRDPAEVTGLASGEAEQQHIRSLRRLRGCAQQSGSAKGAGL